MDALRFPFRCPCAWSVAGLAAFAFAFAFAFAEARAADPPGELSRYSLAAIGGYTFGGTFKDSAADRQAQVDDDAHFGLIFNVRESPNTQWEVFYARQQTRADTADVSPAQPVTDLDIQYLQFGGTYVGDGDRARPFLAATVGGTRFDPGPLTFDSENFFSFGLGAGWYFRASQRLDVRVEGRVEGTVLGSNTAFFCQTGPDDNTCAITSKGDVFWQFLASLGIAWRF